MAETPIVSVIMGVYNTNNENMLRLAILMEPMKP